MGDPGSATQLRSGATVVTRQQVAGRAVCREVPWPLVRVRVDADQIDVRCLGSAWRLRQEAVRGCIVVANPRSLHASVAVALVEGGFWDRLLTSRRLLRTLEAHGWPIQIEGLPNREQVLSAAVPVARSDEVAPIRDPRRARIDP
ncbi:hypothetical protein KSP35_05385 [Aquihabitans sp. G128]|uniref:hypothetical protein n=1 Tax=Aquihabitans sp. G128 TaxID=2849779 RepID=UPI001C2277C3|nr:hypothetical protein [Aquihabitans sp. G128]QXC62241.1 hypothetical protein KSP35_05385 [Aquihabitans sp. G128]